MKDIEKQLDNFFAENGWRDICDTRGEIEDLLEKAHEAGIKEGERRCEERIRGRLCRICYIWERDHERNPITCKSPNMLHTFEKNATPTNTKEEGDN